MKSILASALVFSAALVQAANFVVNVAPGGKLVYDPSSVTAAVGDTIEFKFTVGVSSSTKLY